MNIVKLVEQVQRCTTVYDEAGEIIFEDHVNAVFLSVNDFSNASQMVGKKFCLLLAELVFGVS